MGTEEHEIMKKIQHLSGKIDRRKQRQRPFPSTASYSPYSHGNGHTINAQATASPLAMATDSDGGATSDAPGASWITKNDRHLQLINSSAYKADSHPRLGPSDPGRVQMPRFKTNRAKAKLMNRLHRGNQIGQDAPSPTNSDLAAQPQYTIVVEGTRFFVANGGKKLVRAPGESNPTPKTASVSGAEFRRTKNGNLVRNAWQRTAASKAKTTKLDVPCKFFSTTGIVI